MSRQATDWAFQQRLPAMVRVVLLELANRHNGITGQLNPSVETLAEDCGMSMRSVTNAIADLEKRGMLTRRKRDPKAMKSVNDYFLAFTDTQEVPNDTHQVPNDTQEVRTGYAGGAQGDTHHVRTNQEVLTRKGNSSRGKRETDERHKPFLGAFRFYFKHRTGHDAPWDAKEAKQLDRFLKANPTWTLESWQAMLNNRGKSEVSHGEALSVWIGRATAYAVAPLDRFNQPREQIAPKLLPQPEPDSVRFYREQMEAKKVQA